MSDIPPNIEVVMDVPVEISVELGSCRMPMREVLQIAAGSVIQLDKVADEPVDIFVNRKLIPKGEVVVVEDRFGIKITEIFSK